MKKVGIMGGTFNPIHMGHLILAENARTQYQLDEILFVPSGNSYMKQDVLESKHRLQMTSLAIEDHPDFALSTIEVEREGNTYTYETLKELHQMNPDTEYFFMVGADSLFSIERWKEPQQIMEQCVLLAAIRNGYDMPQIQEKINELKNRFHADIRSITIPNIDISSTDIRDRVCQNESIRYLVPDKVRAYISKNNLYSKQDK